MNSYHYLTYTLHFPHISLFCNRLHIIHFSSSANFSRTKTSQYWPNLTRFDSNKTHGAYCFHPPRPWYWWSRATCCWCRNWPPTGRKLRSSLHFPLWQDALLWRSLQRRACGLCIRGLHAHTDLGQTPHCFCVIASIILGFMSHYIRPNRWLWIFYCGSTLDLYPFSLTVCSSINENPLLLPLPRPAFG